MQIINPLKASLFSSYVSYNESILVCSHNYDVKYTSINPTQLATTPTAE